MNKLTYLPFALLLLLGAALPTSALSPAFLGDGCENYGNQVIVASTQVCSGGGDCENWGTQVVVAGSFDCDGHCPNNGIRVVVAGSMCGDDGTQVCNGSECFPPNPNFVRQSSHMGAASAVDCVPNVHSVGFPPSIQEECDPSGEPCGISGEPVCWASRYLCMNALATVINLYDGLPLDDPRKPSSCEGQPGWSSLSMQSSLETAAVGDCLPYAEIQQTPPVVHQGCDPSGEPCGINQQPLCWTSRYLCMNALILALNAVNHQGQQLLPRVWKDSTCEGQPGWGGPAILAAVNV